MCCPQARKEIKELSSLMLRWATKSNSFAFAYGETIYENLGELIEWVTIKREKKL